MVSAIYDGNCAICLTTKAIIKALDWFNRIEFVDLHDAQHVKTLPIDVPNEKLMGEIHVVTSEGDVYAGFDGTRRLLRECVLTVPLWAMLQLPFVGNWLGPKIYQFIARHRYKINRVLGMPMQEDQLDCVDDVCKLPEKSVNDA